MLFPVVEEPVIPCVWDWEPPLDSTAVPFQKRLSSWNVTLSAPPA